MAAAMASIRAKQYARLEQWFMEANLPPQQDIYSNEVLRHLMPPEDYIMEMRSGAGLVNPDEIGIVDVFDKHSVQLMRRRAFNPEDAVNVISRPEDISRTFFGPESIWNLSKLAVDHPVVFVGLDPAGGSTKISDSVIGSAIFQENYTPAELNLISSKRTWHTAASCHRYFDSTKMHVRCFSRRFRFSCPPLSTVLVHHGG
jgi:hypothetical protein